MNNKIIYWIIAAFFVFVSTLVSIFIVPYLDACIGSYYTKVIILIFGIVILITSIILYFKNKKSKLPAMILFPISLTIILSSAIHFLRFPYESHLFDDYIKHSSDIYSRLGFKLIDGKSRNWVIGYDSYGSKLLINRYSNKLNTGDYYYEDCLDSDGNSKNISDKKCDLYEVEYEVFIFDETGEYVDKLVGTYNYTYNSYSDYQYEYKFYGLRSDADRYSNHWGGDVVNEEIEDLLLDYGIKLK